MKMAVKIFCTVLVSLLVAALCGCIEAVRFAEKPLLVAPPVQWTEHQPGPATQISTGWLRDFDDDHLTKLVNLALANNPDVLVAAERVRSAGARLQITKGDLWPAISAGLSGNRDQSIIEVDSKVYTARAKNHGLSGNVSWEFDLWHRLGDLREADGAEIIATSEDFEGVRFLLAAQTAKAWFSAIEARLQMELSEKTYETFCQGETLLSRRFQAGLTTAMDLRLARASKLAAKDDMIRRKQRSTQAIRDVQLLVGSYPSGRMEIPGELPSSLGTVPAGLPAEIIERRPDILAAKARVVAADYTTSAAEKELFPSLTLTAQTGTSSKDLNNLLNGSYGVWQIGSGLLMPIIQGGKIRANIEQQTVEAKIRWLEYGKTLLSAFGEVEAGLTVELILKKRQTVLRDSVVEAEGALHQSWQSYLAGDTEIITVLASRRSVTDARSGLISVNALMLINRVDLHLALGGSFES